MSECSCEVGRESDPRCEGRGMCGKSAWTREADLSWSWRDSLGTLFRVTEVYLGDAKWMFAMGWQEQEGFRISYRLYASKEEAQQRAEELAGDVRH